jgi:hypothetical protein
MNYRSMASQASIFLSKGSTSLKIACGFMPADNLSAATWSSLRENTRIALSDDIHPKSTMAIPITSFLPHRAKASGDALVSNIALYGAENIFDLTDAGRSFPYSATEVALAPINPSYSPRSVFFSGLARFGLSLECPSEANSMQRTFSFFALSDAGNGNAPVVEVRLCGACVNVRERREVSVVRAYIRQGEFLKATPQVAG